MSTIYLCRFVVKAAILLLLIELSLQFLPACDQPYTTFDLNSNILIYDTQQHGIYTDGNLAQIKAHWRINNMGWNSAYDYSTDNQKPVIAIIGNSYVEAFQVNSDKSLVADLQNKMGTSYDCYGFGYSGSKLSQYLHISRYVRKTFHPKIVVFNIIDGDILGSLGTIGQQPQYTLFLINTPSGISETPIKQFVPSIPKRIYGKIALVRYMLFNKQQSFREQGLLTNESLTHDESEKTKAVANYAFEKIRNENMNTSVFVVIDAPRADIYRGKIQKKNIESREIIANISVKYGINVIDLTDPMAKRYAKNHVKFNFENNYHWNEYGHQFVADQIYQKLIQSGVVETTGNPKKL